MKTELKKREEEEVSTARERRYERPFYAVDSNDKGYAVRIYMPGVSKRDIAVSLDEDTLKVTGHRTHRAPKDWKRIRHEIPDHDYQLQLKLNVKINEKGIKAKTGNGLLDLALPLAEAMKPRSIAIN